MWAFWNRGRELTASFKAKINPSAKNLGELSGPDGRFWHSCHGIRDDGVPMLVIDPIWFDDKGNIKSDGPTCTKQTVNSKQIITKNE